MTIIKRIIIFFFLYFFIFNNSYANDSIAFVDLNYVFANSNAGKKMNKEIQARSKKNNEEFKNLKKKIDDRKQKLLTQKNVLAEEEYKKKYIELEKDINEYNNIIRKKNNDLNNFRAKVKNEFSDRLRFVLEEYVKANSISMIIRKENLLIGKNDLDVTKGILDLFNKNVKKFEIK